MIPKKSGGVADSSEVQSLWYYKLLERKNEEKEKGIEESHDFLSEVKRDLWRLFSANKNFSEVEKIEEYLEEIRISKFHLEKSKLLAKIIHSSYGYLDFKKTNFSRVMMKGEFIKHTTRAFFNGCVLPDEVHKVHFYESEFVKCSVDERSKYEGVKFERSQLEDLTFNVHSRLENCIFDTCKLYLFRSFLTKWKGNLFSNVIFDKLYVSRTAGGWDIEDCKFEGCEFENNCDVQEQIKGCRFNRCMISGSFKGFDRSFFYGCVFEKLIGIYTRDTWFRGCEVENSAFFDCKELHFASWNRTGNKFCNCFFDKESMKNISAQDIVNSMLLFNEIYGIDNEKMRAIRALKPDLLHWWDSEKNYDISYEEWVKKCKN